MCAQGHDGTNRYVSARMIREDEGVIESHLSIQLVRPEDYGQYMCMGKNELGQKTALIQVFGMFILL